MAAIIIRNPSAAERPPVAPRKTGGGFYMYEMIFSGRRAYADQPADLVDALSPGYLNLERPERVESRVRLAIDLQTQLQAALATTDLLNQCSAEERQVILATRDNPPAPATWTAAVPLVLVATFYHPKGSLPRPAGPADRQIWLDPDDDMALLISLHTAGIVQISSRDSS